MTSSSRSMRRMAIAGSLHWRESLADGQAVDVRSLSAADYAKESAFLSRLSKEFRSYRFLGLVRDLHEDVALSLLILDPDHEMALGAFVADEDGEVEVGAAWYRTDDTGARCDCTVTVDPKWQGLGIGSMLMGHLIEVARARGVRHMYAADADGCTGLHALAERMGFRSRPDPEDRSVAVFERTLA